MDACTTSPVESANNSIKHGPWKVHSNMNLDRATKRMLSGIDARLSRRRNAAQRELNKSSYYSRAPTKDYVIPKGQGLIDHEFDSRLKLKSVQIDPETWLTWDFDSWMEDFADNLDVKNIDSDSLHVHLPVFLRVRQVKVNSTVDKSFLLCDCKKWKKRGLPCRCFFRSVDNGEVEINGMLDLGMIDIRYWKVYHSHYGEMDDESGKFTDLAQSLYQAQSQSFKYENEGIQVSDELLSKIIGSKDASYPILGPNTTMEDYEEMQYVRSQPYFTLADLMERRMDEDWDDDIPLSQLNHGGENERVLLSSTASAMQAAVSSAEVAETHKSASNNVRDTFVGECMKYVRFVGDDKRVSGEMMNEFLNHVKEGYNKVVEGVKDREAITKKRTKEKGGDGKVMVYGTTGDVGERKKRHKSLGYL